eukprot:1367619-Pyramimonas_sp.AAC.1
MRKGCAALELRLEECLCLVCVLGAHRAGQRDGCQGGGPACGARALQGDSGGVHSPGGAVTTS